MHALKYWFKMSNRFFNKYSVSHNGRKNRLNQGGGGRLPHRPLSYSPLMNVHIKLIKLY